MAGPSSIGRPPWRFCPEVGQQLLSLDGAVLATDVSVLANYSLVTVATKKESEFHQLLAFCFVISWGHQYVDEIPLDALDLGITDTMRGFLFLFSTDGVFVWLFVDSI